MVLWHSLRTAFCSAPRRAAFDWIPVLYGIVLLGLSPTGALIPETRGTWFSVDPVFAILGVAFVLLGGAELLPSDRERVAAVARVLAVAAFLAWFVALFLGQ